MIRAGSIPDRRSAFGQSEPSSKILSHLGGDVAPSLAEHPPEVGSEAGSIGSRKAA